MKITTTTGVHHDDIELEQSAGELSRYHTRVTHSITPNNFVNLKKDNTITSESHNRREAVKSDGLSLDSDSDLDLEVAENGRPDRRVDWRGML